VKSSTLRKRFFESAIADVLRAVDGRALIGSTALALCILDYLAYLRSAPSRKQDADDYKGVVKDYLVPINNDYQPSEIYAWRCAMVHTYAEASALKAAGIEAGFLMSRRDPSFHLSKPRAKALAINVDTFVADVIWATHKFFLKTDGDSDIEKRADGLIVVSHGGWDMVSGYEDWVAGRATYASMHPALRELDSASPDLTRLRNGVTAIYPAALGTTLSPPTSGSTL
jgi:hypothetical protein